MMDGGSDSTKSPYSDEMFAKDAKMFLQSIADWFSYRGIPPITIVFFVVCVTVQITILACLLVRFAHQRWTSRAVEEDYERLGADYFLVDKPPTSEMLKVAQEDKLKSEGRKSPQKKIAHLSTSDPNFPPVPVISSKPPPITSLGKFAPQPYSDGSSRRVSSRLTKAKRGVSLKEDSTTAAKKRSLYAGLKSHSTPDNLCRGSFESFDSRKDSSAIFSDDVTNAAADTPPSKYGKISFAVTYDKESQQLRIFLEQAAQLAVKSAAGLADTIVKITLSPDCGIPSSTSKVVRKTSNPVYRQNFTFRVSPEVVKDLAVKFQVFELDGFSHNDPIGEVEYPLSHSLTQESSLPIWKDLNKSEKVKDFKRGDILFSLTYLPNAERLTVVLLKARNLRLAEWGDHYVGKSVLDTFVKVTLVKSGKVIKYKQTRLTRKSCNPVYNEGFALHIRQADLDEVSLTLAVCVRLNHLGFHRVIGRCIVGRHVGAEGSSHWRDMINSPRSGVGQWHSLV